MLEALRNTADKVLFAIRHSTTPEIATHAREVLLVNQNILDSMLEAGLVTEQRLEEIAQDNELKKRYASLLKRSQDGGKAKNDTFRDLSLLPPDELGGWFEYLRKMYEWRWGLKLISPED